MAQAVQYTSHFCFSERSRFHSLPKPETTHGGITRLNTFHHWILKSSASSLTYHLGWIRVVLSLAEWVTRRRQTETKIVIAARLEHS